MFVAIKSKRIYKVLKEYDWDIQEICDDINDYAKTHSEDETSEYMDELLQQQVEAMGYYNKIEGIIKDYGIKRFENDTGNPVNRNAFYESSSDLYMLISEAITTKEKQKTQKAQPKAKARPKARTVASPPTPPNPFDEALRQVEEKRKKNKAVSTLQAALRRKLSKKPEPPKKEPSKSYGLLQNTGASMLQAVLRRTLTKKREPEKKKAGRPKGPKSTMTEEEKRLERNRKARERYAMKKGQK